MERTIGALVENHFGVLSHVSGLFSSRGFNIKSLSVGETEDSTVSRMTIVVDADERILEQVKKQLNKLIDVIKVFDLTEAPSVERELMLIKVEAPSTKRSEIIEIVDIFRASIVDVSTKHITIEVTGDSEKIEAMINMLKPYNIKELARTGKVSLSRGNVKS